MKFILNKNIPLVKGAHTKWRGISWAFPRSAVGLFAAIFLKQKGFPLLSLTRSICFILLFFILFCNFSQGQTSTNTLNIENWKIYSFENAKLKLLYPKNILTLTVDSDKIFLSHSIAYEHPDFCDLEGAMPSEKYLTDVFFYIKVFKKGFADILKNTQGADFLKQYFSGDSLIFIKGFIEKIKIGRLSGYVIQMGAEGCGTYQYYFPIGQQLTLLITRPYSPETIGLLPEEINNKLLSLKGRISPEDADKIFFKVLETIK